MQWPSYNIVRHSIPEAKVRAPGVSNILYLPSFICIKIKHSVVSQQSLQRIICSMYHQGCTPPPTCLACSCGLRQCRISQIIIGVYECT